MPLGLTRLQTEGHNHLITFSCHNRRPFLNTPVARDLFEHSLERTRRKYLFDIHAYVVMPEHVHLLVSEPQNKPLSTALQALKLSVSKQSPQHPFWHTRYHDFNVFTARKHIEKTRYIHRNPVTRGLVADPEDWPHSSYLTHLHTQQRTVHITFYSAPRVPVFAHTHQIPSPPNPPPPSCVLFPRPLLLSKYAFSGTNLTKTRHTALSCSFQIFCG